VLGQRNDQVTADFLLPYITECSTPEEGRFLTQIEILKRLRAKLLKGGSKGYTEQQAVHDYHQARDKIIVQVTLVMRALYAGAAQDKAQGTSLRPENFWQNFRFSLKQRGKVIPTRSICNDPIYSTSTKNAPPILDGATVHLEYDSKNVASEEANIEVRSPDSKTIKASFDLKKLR